MARLSSETDPAKAVKDADLVIEAIVENMDIKHKLFGLLDKAAPRSVKSGLFWTFELIWFQKLILLYSLNAFLDQALIDKFLDGFVL